MGRVASAQGIRTYDFRRPDRLSKEQLGALSRVFDSFGRFLAPEMSGFLRAPARMGVTGVDQQVYEDLIGLVPPTACMAVFHAGQLGGRVVALMSNEDATFVTDLMLGGRGEGLATGRPLGETDRLVLERLFALWPDALRTAWSPLAEVDVAFEAVEGSLEFVQLASAQETVVTVHMAIGGLSRPVAVDILLLHTGLQPLMARLHSAGWPAAGRARARRVRDAVQRTLLDTPLRLRVRIEGLPLGVLDLATLRPGDVVSLGRPIERPLTLWAGNRPLGWCRLGAVGSRVAVQTVADDTALPTGAPQ
jgi:flagellar motor switch protein FliM